MMEHVPPQCLELERHVLGLLTNGCQVLPMALEKLEKSDFYLPLHQAIFAEIKKVYERDGVVDVFSVAASFEETKNTVYINAGGRNCITMLIELNFAFFQSDLPNLIKRIKEKATLRRFIGLLHEYQAEAHYPDVNPEDIIQELTEELVKLKNRDSGTELRPICDILPDVYNDLEKLNSDEEEDVIKADLYDLEKLTGGFQKGTLNVIAGRPGMGKSTVALDMAVNLAWRKKKKVAYFSLEMTGVQLTKKLIAKVCADIDGQAPTIHADQLFHPKKLGLQDFSKINQVLPTIGDFDLWIDDNSSSSPGYIRGQLTRLIQESGYPDVVIVDYVGIMGTDERHQNRVLEVDTTLKELRRMAKDFNFALIALAQINRGVESQMDKRPGLKDIRESGSYEQEAAIVIGLYNQQYYNKELEPLLELLVLKNRFGETGKATVLFDGAHSRLMNMA